MNESLKYKLFSNTDCLSEQMLFDYIDKKLSPKEQHIVEKHVMDCDFCSDALEGLQLLKDRRRLDKLNKLINTKIANKQEAKIVVFKPNYRIITSIAAGLILLIGSVFFFKFFLITKNEMSMVNAKEPPSSSLPVDPSQEEAVPLEKQTTDSIHLDDFEKGEELYSINKQNVNKSNSLKKVEEKTSREEQADTDGLTNSADKSESTGEREQSASEGANKKFELETPKQNELESGLARKPVSQNILTGKEETIYESAPTTGTQKVKEKKTENNRIVDQSIKLAEKDFSKDSKTKEALKEKNDTEQEEIIINSPADNFQLTDEKEKKSPKSKLRKENFERSSTTPKATTTAHRIDVGDAERIQRSKDSPAKMDASTYKNEDKTYRTHTDSIVHTEAFVSELEAAPDSVYTHVDEMPQYVGGNEALIKYMQNTIAKAGKADVGGEKNSSSSIINVQFTINKNGKAINPKVLKNTDKAVEKAIADAIHNMPLWKPGKLKGKAVDVKYTLPVAIFVK